jgi:hypothetical protein
MTEFISTKINEEGLWLKFFKLSQEISRKHYSDHYNPEDTVEKFTKRRKDSAANDPTHDEYVVFYNGNVAGWFDTSVWNKELYFGFDTVFDECDENLLKAILIKFDEIMNEKNFTDSLYYTYREPIFSALKKTGAAVDEEYVISRVERKDMDSEFYKEIVRDNPLEKWKLEYYYELPENIIEQYAKCYNECWHDMFTINPYPAKATDITTEYIKTVMETHKKNGTTNPMYILFDDACEIAGLCSICIDSSRPDTLRHVGSLTAVPAKHRGKGIARYLKAKLYLKLLEENKDFKYITTDTMPWNKYMYKINSEFGFKPFRKGCSFRISRDFIKNYINHIG